MAKENWVPSELKETWTVAKTVPKVSGKFYTNYLHSIVADVREEI